MIQKQCKTFTHNFSLCENASFYLVKDIYWLKHVGAHTNTLMQCQNIVMEEESLKQLCRNVLREGPQVWIICPHFRNIINCISEHHF